MPQKNSTRRRSKTRRAKRKSPKRKPINKKKSKSRTRWYRRLSRHFRRNSKKYALLLAAAAATAAVATLYNMDSRDEKTALGIAQQFIKGNVDGARRQAANARDRVTDAVQIVLESLGLRPATSGREVALSRKSQSTGARSETRAERRTIRNRVLQLMEQGHSSEEARALEAAQRALPKIKITMGRAPRQKQLPAGESKAAAKSRKDLDNATAYFKEWGMSDQEALQAAEDSQSNTFNPLVEDGRTYVSDEYMGREYNKNRNRRK